MVLAAFGWAGDRPTMTLEELAKWMPHRFWRTVDSLTGLPEDWPQDRLGQLARLLKHWDFEPRYYRGEFVDRLREEFDDEWDADETMLDMR